MGGKPLEVRVWACWSRLGVSCWSGGSIAILEGNAPSESDRIDLILETRRVRIVLVLRHPFTRTRPDLAKEFVVSLRC